MAGQKTIHRDEDIKRRISTQFKRRSEKTLKVIR